MVCSSDHNTVVCMVVGYTKLRLPWFLITLIPSTCSMAFSMRNRSSTVYPRVMKSLMTAWVALPLGWFPMRSKAPTSSGVYTVP